MAAREPSEERRHAERIKHETLVRQKQMEAKINERDACMKEAQKNDDILRQEIELLVLEKQRNTMEEEIDDDLRDAPEDRRIE